MTLLDRFFAKASIASFEGCWPWHGWINKNGYGLMKVNYKHQRAHRVAYELAFGNIPAGKVLDHLCRNRNCVNPLHLDPVTIGENVLRGQTLPAQNAGKTSCPEGHPYDVLRANGSRECRVCKNRKYREWYHKQKEKS